MKKVTRSKAEFDGKLNELRSIAGDWAARECTSFDAAVQRAAGIEDGDGSIWDMPAIDSKRVVSLLVELEPVLGCRLPTSLIKRGGYASAEELKDNLFTKIRELCSDANGPGLSTATPSVSTNISNSQVPA